MLVHSIASVLKEEFWSQVFVLVRAPDTTEHCKQTYNAQGLVWILSQLKQSLEAMSTD